MLVFRLTPLHKLALSDSTLQMLLRHMLLNLLYWRSSWWLSYFASCYFHQSKAYHSVFNVMVYVCSCLSVCVCLKEQHKAPHWYPALKVLLLGKLHSVLSFGPVIFHVRSSSPQHASRRRKAPSATQLLLSSISQQTTQPFHFLYRVFYIWLFHVSLLFPLLRCLISFLSCFLPLSALSCWDKLMHEFPTAPHHGRLPYQGQESALQHLQHFISALSKCRGSQESEAPRAGIHRCTLLSPLLFSMTGQERV